MWYANLKSPDREADMSKSRRRHIIWAFSDLYVYLYQFSCLFAASFLLPSLCISNNSTSKQLKPDPLLPTHRLKLSTWDYFCTWNTSWLPNPKLYPSTLSSFHMHRYYSFKVSRHASVQAKICLNIDRVKQASAEFTPIRLFGIEAFLCLRRLHSLIWCIISAEAQRILRNVGLFTSAGLLSCF